MLKKFSLALISVSAMSMAGGCIIISTTSDDDDDERDIKVMSVFQAADGSTRVVRSVE